MKEDITLLDNTGTTPLHVWGDSIRKLVSKKSYTVTHLTLKMFQEELYLSTTFSSQILDTSLPYMFPEEQLIEEGDTMTAKGFSSVVSVKMFWRCKNCSSPMEQSTADNGKVKGNNSVQDCTRKYKTSTLKQHIEATVSLDQDGVEVVVVLSDEVLAKMGDDSENY